MRKKHFVSSDIVINSAGKSNDIKILLPLIITLVLAGVILTVTVTTLSDKNKTSEVQVQSSTQVASEDNPVQTTLSPTTVKEKVTLSGDGYIFASGKYYLEGTLFTDSSQNGISVSVVSDGENSEIASVYKQMWLGIMNLNGEKYLVDLSSKSYIEYSEKSLSELNTASLDYDIVLPSDISSLDYTETSVNINGEKGVGYIAVNGNKTYEIITLNSELKQITVVDSENKGNYRIIVENISSAIPEDRLSLDNLYESTSVFSFFSAITN